MTPVVIPHQKAQPHHRPSRKSCKGPATAGGQKARNGPSFGKFNVKRNRSQRRREGPALQQLWPCSHWYDWYSRHRIYHEVHALFALRIEALFAHQHVYDVFRLDDSSMTRSPLESITLSPPSKTSSVNPRSSLLPRLLPQLKLNPKPKPKPNLTPLHHPPHPPQTPHPLPSPPQKKAGAPPPQNASPTSWTTCNPTSSSPPSASTT